MINRPDPSTAMLAAIALLVVTLLIVQASRPVVAQLAAGGPIGACCLVDTATCIITDPMDCFLQGGFYMGDFTKCTKCFPCGPGAGNCCAANGTPSCDDKECCTAVCFIDPFCCDTVWDGNCAAVATDLCDVCAPPRLSRL